MAKGQGVEERESEGFELKLRRIGGQGIEGVGERRKQGVRGGD